MALWLYWYREYFTCSSRYTVYWGATGSSLTPITMLCPWARHINPILVLVQPRRTCPFITERLLMGHKESHWTNKTNTLYLTIKLWNSHFWFYKDSNPWTRPPDKSVLQYWKIIFAISQPKHMLWVLKRTISMRWFFWAPKTHV